MSISKFSKAQGANSNIPTAGRFAQISGGTETTYTESGVTYNVHTFTSSGTLTVTNSGVVDVLVVGGGGGGAVDDGAGGGGAGGLIEQGGVFVPSGSVSVTVGAGGPGGTSVTDTTSMIGLDSVFLGITAIGGGASRNESGSVQVKSELSGGCGAGAGGGTGAYGPGTGRQGFGGGTSTQGSPGWPGGGGGGMGSAGGNSTSTVGGSGGNGVTSSLQTGSAITYCGGGGGSTNNSSYTPGSGGTGGGGAGGAGTNGTDGTANTGGGGGAGSGPSYDGGSGGSGIVVVRTIATTPVAVRNFAQVSGGTVSNYTEAGVTYQVNTFTVAGLLTLLVRVTLMYFLLVEEAGAVEATTRVAVEPEDIYLQVFI